MIWDVSAVSWLLNDQNQYMSDLLIPAPIPEYDMQNAFCETRHLMRYVYDVNRDAVFEDLFRVLSE